MQRVEFDQFADEYHILHAGNIRLSGETPEFFAAYKVGVVAELVRLGRLVLPPMASILDFGSGVGQSTAAFRAAFPDAKLLCLDVSERSLRVGRQRHAGSAHHVVFDGATLPLPDGAVDIAFAACVFHHIEAERQPRLLAELRRVLKPTGGLFVFEHNPLNPLTVHAVNTCPFDENAVLIRAGEMRRRLLTAGFRRAEIEYRLFFPNALRALRPLERRLARLPFGAQYFALGRKG